MPTQTQTMSPSKRMEALRDAIAIVGEATRTAIKTADHATFKILIDALDNLYRQYADATFAHFGIPGAARTAR